MQLHYSQNGSKLGPISSAEFEKLVKEGVIAPDTLVWHPGMANWEPYEVASAAIAAAVDTETEVCAVSGKRYPKREMVQYDGKWISSEHRDEFFQRLREGVTQPGTVVYGNFWPRFLAKFLDGLIQQIGIIPLNMLFAFLFIGTVNFVGANRGMLPQRALEYSAVTGLCGLALRLGFYWFFLAKWDATPGKMAVGMKVIRSDGSKLSNGRIIGRYFAEILSSLIFCIGYLIAYSDPERRTLHDRICDTRVVKVK